jgi:fumarate hydratase subunit beta
MITEIQIQTPLQNSKIEQLSGGTKVLLSGRLFTARDAAHKRLVELIKAGKPLPFDIRGAVIYYVGPTPALPGKSIGSAGPTTSYRMDPYTPLLLEAGLKGMIGKGPRSPEVIDALVRYRAVYFVAIGGAGVIMAQAVQSSKVIAFADLGTEAIRELQVENFPVFVANDINGNDIFQMGIAKYQTEK